MSKGKIKKVILNNQRKILAIFLTLLAIITIVGIGVYASSTDNDYVVEIKDDGSENISTDENSSVTKKIVEDTPKSVTYEVQIKNLTPNTVIPEVAVVIDSSRSMGVNDIDESVKTKAIQLINELRSYSPKTKISLVTNTGIKVNMSTSTLSIYTDAINAITYSDGESVTKAIDYANSSFSASTEKYLVIFSDATDSTKEKIELATNNGIEVYSVLTDIINNEYETSTLMGNVQMISDVTDFSYICYRVNRSIVNVVLTDYFSDEVNEYFNFDEVSKDSNLEMEKTSNGYILKCNEIKAGETKTYKFRLTLKDDAKIDAGKIYRTLQTSNNSDINYKNYAQKSNKEDKSYEIEKSPTFVICKKYSLTIKAVSEKSKDLPVKDLNVKVIGTIVDGQDEFGNDIIKTVYDKELRTDSKGKIVIDELKTLGDITFEIKPLVDQFGYQETSATQVIVHNDPTGVGTIWAETDIGETPEVDPVNRNITVLLPILVDTFKLDITTVDANNDKVNLGNIQYRLIQPKLNSKYDMEALYGTSDSDGRLTLSPAIMTKDGSYQYILSQMSEQEGYDGMGNVTLIITFEDGKVTKITSKYNDLVTTQIGERGSNTASVIVGNVSLSDDSFGLEINLKDKETNEKLFGAVYDIKVTRVASSGEQITSNLNNYITDTDGKISIETPGNGYINVKITEKRPKSGYVADEEVKEFTFLRKNGTVQNITSNPGKIDVVPDSDNNKVIVNLTSLLASEQNRIQIHLVDNDEPDVGISGVLLGINKVGETNIIQAITNRDGIANFIVSNEEKGSYQYEIQLLSVAPSGFLAPSAKLGVISVEYNNDKFIFAGKAISSTTPDIKVEFEQMREEIYKYDTAKVQINLEPDPATAYKLKIQLQDRTKEDSIKGIAGAKYSIQMESDGVEVKYLAGKLTDENGNYTTRITGGGKNITIRIKETSTLPGYIITEDTQVIELELTDTGYEITNSSPNVYDPENNKFIGTELVGKELVYHDVNESKTGANTILNLYVNKVDTNDCRVAGVKVRLKSSTLKDKNDNPLDYAYEVIDEDGNKIKKNYYETDENGYFEILGIKVQGDKLTHGERVDYIDMYELDEEGEDIVNTKITFKITFRENEITKVVEVTNVESTWGNRLVKDKTFSSRESDKAYESDVHLDLFTNFDEVGNFALDLKKVNKDGKTLPNAKYDVIITRPNSTTLVRRDINVGDSVELQGVFVSKGTKIEITEKEAPIGYELNRYTEVLTITEVNTITGLVTCELEPSTYETPRAKIANLEPIINSDGESKLVATLELIDYEIDTFKFGIKAQDSEYKVPVQGYSFNITSTEGAWQDTKPTNAEGKTSAKVGANYEIENYEVTYTIKTLKTADYYKKLENPIEVKVIFDLSGRILSAKTDEANATQLGYKTVWDIIATNTVDGNDIDIVINVDPCDPLVVNIKTQDTITNKELTNIEYKITPTVNIPATGTTRIDVGYVLLDGMQTYTIKQTNADSIINYKEVPEQKIKVTYDEQGNVVAVDELTKEVHKISINEKEINILIDAEPEVPFNMKNIAYFHNNINIVNSKFEISVDDDKTKEILTDTMGEDTKYSGKFETSTSKIYTVKNTNAGTGYAKVEDFQIEVFFDENRNITDAKILGNVNEFIDFVSVSVTVPSTTSDRGYNGNDKGIVNITVKSYPQVEFAIENVDRRDEKIKLAGTVYKVESRKVDSDSIYTKDEQIVTGSDGIGIANLDKSGYRTTIRYTITEISPSARYQTLTPEAQIDVEFNEFGYIINTSIVKRSDVLEIIVPTISTVEDNFKLRLKIKSNPELKINITKVDSEDTSIVIPNVSFELTARIVKDNLSEFSAEDISKLTLNTAELSEEDYLAQVLDLLKVDREEVENLRKNIGIKNTIKELKDSGKLTAEEEEDINAQINDNLKINKIVSLGKLTKTQINERIDKVTNSVIIDTLIKEDKTSRDRVNELLNTVKNQLRLDVDNIMTNAEGLATAYMDKTLANKTILYTLKETKKVPGYDWLSETITFEVTYDANGKMIEDTPVRSSSEKIQVTNVNQDEFEISVTVKNTPSKEVQIHLTVEDVYDSNKKLEVAGFDAYLVNDTDSAEAYAPDNDFRVSLETGSETTGTGLKTAHGEDTESMGIYDRKPGTRILRFVETKVPTSYYIGNDKYEATYQSIAYALLVDVTFDDQGCITSTSLHKPGSDSVHIGYIADGRYIQVSHTRNTINVTIKYYPMLQVQMQTVDKYTQESIEGKFTIDTHEWQSGDTHNYRVSAGYINPYTSNNYYYGRQYKSEYKTSNAITNINEASRVAIAPTEADIFEENKKPSTFERTLYIYENEEPNSPIQYQTYLPRHITNSSQYLLAIVKVKYDRLGQVEGVETIQLNSSNNIKTGFFTNVKAEVNEHTIQIKIEYAPITTIKTTVIDEVSGVGLSGIRVNPYIDGNYVTSTSYEYRTTLYYTTGNSGKTGWTYWGGSTANTLNRYVIDTYTTGSGYEGYFDPNNIILDVSYGEDGRISDVSSRNTDEFGDDNVLEITWENNDINVTIKYCRRFKVMLNKVDYYDTNKTLNAAFDIKTSTGTTQTVAANTLTTVGKVYAGQTVRYTMSETAVPSGYIPIENLDIIVEFNNNGSVRRATSDSDYYEFLRAAPAEEKNSMRKEDLVANIKNKPRFDVTIELSDRFYPTVKLQGGTFTIESSKGESHSGGLVTDKNGILETYVGTVYPNEVVTYTIKQTNTIPGYRTNNVIVKFKVEFNENGKIATYSLIEGSDIASIAPTKYVNTKGVKVDITNKPKDVKVGIYKYDQTTEEVMPDVKFKLKTEEVGKVDIQKEVITNADGTVIEVVDEFEELEIPEYKTVKYTISEIEAAESYRKIQDVVVQVTYREDGSMYYYDVLNNESEVDVKVATSGEISYINEEPVHIKLTIPNDNAYDLIVKNEDINYPGLGVEGTVYDVSINGVSQEPITTNDKGIAIIKDQTQTGEITITVTERKIGEGYRENKNNTTTIKLEKGIHIYSLKSIYNSNPTYAIVVVDEEHGTVTVTFKNETKLELTMQKEDINTEELLPGVVFEIKEEELDDLGNVVEGTEKIITTDENNTTDTDGLLYFDLGLSKPNKTVQYTFTEVTPPEGYTQILPETVVVKFDAYGHIIEMKDTSRRIDCMLASDTGKSHHMIVTVGNGTLNEAYTVKIVTEDSVSKARINNSVFEAQVIEKTTGVIERHILGSTKNNSKTIAGSKRVLETGALMLKGIRSEGDIDISFRQIETAIGYEYGTNKVSGNVTINAKFELEDNETDKKVTLSVLNPGEFDVSIDNINREITIKVFNDPEVNFKITKVSAGTEAKLKDVKFHITSAITEDGVITPIDYSGDIKATDEEGFTRAMVGNAYAGKTVIYTITEDTIEGYKELKDVILSVEYDGAGRIANTQILSSKDDIEIEEYEDEEHRHKIEEKVYKYVVEKDIDLVKYPEELEKLRKENIDIEIGTGSRILQMKIINHKEPSDYKIQIGKYHEDTTYPYLIPGAKYQISVTQQYGKAETTWIDITDENGIITSPYFSGHGWIEVAITELEAPEGFELDKVTQTTRMMRNESTGKIVIHSTDSGARTNEDCSIIYLQPVDKVLDGLYNIIINKVDAKSGNLINENPATIKVELEETIETITETLNEETGEIVESVETTTVRTPVIEDVTDNNGRIIANTLKAPSIPGEYTYVLTEVKAPNNYEPIKETEVKIAVTFALNEDSEMIITNVVVKDGVIDVKAGKNSDHVMSIIVYNTSNEDGSTTLLDDEYGIDLRKVDSELHQITSGVAEFTLTNTVTNETINIETDELGRAQLVKFKIPKEPVIYKYKLTETKAPKGYKLSEHDIDIITEFAQNEEGEVYLQRVSVEGPNAVYTNKTEGSSLPDRKIELKVINEDLSYTIKIEKHHEADPYYPYFIEGVEFDIKITQEFGTPTIELTKTTNKDGIINIEDLHGYGKIKVEITEKSAPDKYQLDSATKHIEFYRNKASKELQIYGDSTVNYKFDEENQKVILMPINTTIAGLYDIVINKVDKATDTIITKNPAQFNLYMINKYSESEETGVRIPIIQNESTDDLGMLVKDSISMPTEPGVYTFELEESKAPEGYEGIKETARFEVTIDRNEKNEPIITKVEVVKGSENVKVVTWKNKFISLSVLNKTTIPEGKVSFNITKVDESKNKITTDTAVFKVIDNQTGDIYYTETNEVALATQLLNKPEKEGTYSYTIKEIKAPEGYALEKNDINITLEYAKRESGEIYLNKVTVEGVNVVYKSPEEGKLPSDRIEIQVMNKIGSSGTANDKPYTVIINKIDSVTKENILDRTTFDIALVNGEIVHASTNEKGQIIIENVYMPSVPGENEIIVKETKAPEGYALDEEMKVVKVTFSGIGKEMVISNIELTETESKNIEIVTEECTEDKIVLNILNEAENDKLYVKSKEDERGEDIYDILESYEGRHYSINEPFIDTKIAKYGSNMTVQEFIDNLESNGTLTILNKDGNELSPEDRVKTGMTLRAVKGEEKLTFKIVVKGDTDGDGRVRSKDLDKLINHLSGKTPITDPIALRALDLKDNGGDGRIRSTDLNEFYNVSARG